MSCKKTTTRVVTRWKRHSFSLHQQQHEQAVARSTETPHKTRLVSETGKKEKAGARQTMRAMSLLKCAVAGRAVHRDERGRVVAQSRKSLPSKATFCRLLSRGEDRVGSSHREPLDVNVQTQKQTLATCFLQLFRSSETTLNHIPSPTPTTAAVQG